ANAADAAGDMAEDAGAAIENAAADAGDAVEAVAVSAQGDAASAYAALTGDAAQGRRVFAKCMACHTVQEGQNRVGPSLYNIIGREAGSVEGFNYTDANANSGIVWTEEVMFAYLENPQEYIPGTRMIFPGLPSEQDRADVIAYLKSASE
ncbi:MAG: cytochrome c family protein, partial [Pseudomonadota bacterium]